MSETGIFVFGLAVLGISICATIIAAIASDDPESEKDSEKDRRSSEPPLQPHPLVTVNVG